MARAEDTTPELLRASPRLRDLFLREALNWVGLWPYPNVLVAEGATLINGQVFLVLQYAEYGSLRECLQHPGAVTHSRQSGAPGCLPLGTSLQWAQHIVAGLLVLHTPDPQMLRLEPLVYRDLKPENVLIDLIDANQYAVITDFGLAKAVEVALEGDPAAAVALALVEQAATATPHEPEAEATRSRRYQTRRGAALGTLQYMAPEQWVDASSASPPADVYAFALILSELLAGSHALLDLDGPYGEAAWRVAHANGTPRPLRQMVPGLPPALEQLYAACLAKLAGDRPTARPGALPRPRRPICGPYAAHMRATILRPDSAPAWYNRANNQAQWGRVERAADHRDAARAHFQAALLHNDRAIALNPNNPDYQYLHTLLQQVL